MLQLRYNQGRGSDGGKRGQAAKPSPTAAHQTALRGKGYPDQRNSIVKSLFQLMCVEFSPTG